MKNSILNSFSVIRKIKMGALLVVTLFLFGSSYLLAQPGWDCINAIPITCSASATGTTVGANTAAIPSACATPNGTGGKVWYSITGTGGAMVVTTCIGTSFNTKIWVYSGTCGSLVCVNGNDDACGTQSTVVWPTTLGTEYFILVGGNGTSEGSYQLSLGCPAPPVNDECANAINFGTVNSINPLCQVVDLLGATQSMAACTGSASNDLWYQFTVPASAGASATVYYSAINNSGSSDRVFELFTSCGGFSIACSDPESGAFSVSPGTYLLRVHTFAAGTSKFDLCLYLAPPVPFNDEMCNALTIKPTTATALNTYGLFGDLSCSNRIVNTFSATASGANEASCGLFNAKSVWFKFTTPMCDVGGIVPFQIEVSTDNAYTSFDTKIELFSSSDGTCNGAITSLGCVDNGISSITTCGGADLYTSTIVNASLAPNTTYFMLLDGYFGASGFAEVSGRVLTAPHSAVASTPTELTMSTPDKGASLYTYYIRPTGSTGYAIFNSTSLTYSRLVSNGANYQTQILYRCANSLSQFYRTPVVAVNVAASSGCAPISTLNCAQSGPGNYTLTWDEVAGVFTNGGALSGYAISYSAIGSSGYTYLSNPAVSCSGGTCSFDLPGLTDPAGYEFWVYSRCTAILARKSNIASCVGFKSATSDVHTFVNPVSGTEFVDVRLSDDWNNFDLVFPDLGDYYVGINKENEIYALKIAEPNMIHSGADVSFELVPNPTNASTTMTFNSTIKSGTYQVVDPMGRNILSGDISNTNTIELDGSKWNAGVYLVNVITNDKTTMRRLVISK